MFSSKKITVERALKFMQVILMVDEVEKISDQKILLSCL